MQVHVDNAEVARFLGSIPSETLEVLALWAESFADVEEAEGFAEQLAEEHSGSIFHQTVGPFLQLLAKALLASEGQSA